MTGPAGAAASSVEPLENFPEALRQKLETPIETPDLEQSPGSRCRQDDEGQQGKIGDDGIEGNDADVPDRVARLVSERVIEGEDALEYVEEEQDTDENEAGLIFGDEHYTL